MEVTVHIHDDIASHMTGDLQRIALEALVAEQYRLGHVDKPDLLRLLGLETSYQIDGFLKAHNIWIEYTMADLELELAGFRRLGL